MGDVDTSQFIEEKVSAQLVGGEDIVRSDEGKGAPSDAPPLFFAIIWTGFSLLWGAAAFFSGGGAFALFCLPFLAIGIFLFVKIIRGGSKEYYALTNNRVFIIQGKVTRAEYLDCISDVKVYPGVKPNVSVVRIFADYNKSVPGNDGVFGDIYMNNVIEAENLCRQILSEKERYTAYKNDQRM